MTTEVPQSIEWERIGGARVARAEWLAVAESVRNEGVALDLIYADPPFNTGQKQSDRAGAYQDRFGSTGAYIAWLEERVRASVGVLKPTGSILLHVDWRTSHRVRVMLDEVLGEDRFVNHLVWSYGLGGSSPRRFARKHDDILWYCINPAEYWFEAPRVPATSVRLRGKSKKATDVLVIPADAGDALRGDVLEVASINNMAGERVGYPTQKPLALLELLVRACCPPGGTVWDPCCGSGTTAVAAMKAGRDAIATDASAEAIEVAKRRIRG